MSTPAATTSPFSATVSLSLEINGETHPVSAVSPDRFVLQNAQLLEEKPAVLNINIDGHLQQTAITITPAESPTREYLYTRQ